jgi:amino acid permease
MSFVKNFILPTSLLAGTVIGAGIFSLPYVFSQAGIGLGFIFLMIFGAVYIFVHLMYADLVIKNGEQHRFAGLARIYFGKISYGLSVVMTIVEMFFVLTIYLILSSSFISLVAPQLPAIYNVILFWWLGSIIIFSGTRKIAFFETLAVGGILVAIALVAYLGAPHFFQKPFIFASHQPIFWLLPFGALLFSINGRPAIPSLIHYFRKNGLNVELSKRAIVWGTIIPIFAYGTYVVGALGISKFVSQDSISGIIGGISSPLLIIVLAMLGILSLISSYFSIGLDVYSSLQQDVKFSKIFSMFLVIIFPLTIYFMNLGGFIAMVEIAGGIFIGLEGILILAMWGKMKKGLTEIGSTKKMLMSWDVRWLKYFLYGIFMVSIGYTIAAKIFNF